jgi:membrane-associated phospholipid phosphatase
MSKPASRREGDVARTYLNFDLVIAGSGGAYEARVAASPAGEAAGVFEPPFSDADLENFRLRSGRGYSGVRRGDPLGSEAARDVGRRLFAAAFGGSIGERLRASLQAVRAAGGGLRLRVTGPPELGDLPWEYLYSPDLDQFLAVSTETPIVRYLAQQEAVPPLAIAAPLNVLVVMASPSDYPRIDVEREWTSLSGAVAEVEQRGLIRLDRLEDASLTALQRRLRQRSYHVVHFVGHGAYDARSQEGMLILEGPDRKGTPVSARRLGVILHDHPTLRLVVLNACEGGRTAPGDGYGGAAQALVRARIPGVIAMQFEISNEAATTLAEEFYKALVDGYPVDAALAEARKAIYVAGSGMEWGTPVLYTLSPDNLLFSLDTASVRAVTGSSAPAAPKERTRERAGAHPAAARSGVVAARAGYTPVTSSVPGELASHSAGRARSGAARGKLTALLVLLFVFVVNLGQTALEGRWSPTVTARGLEFASALHWFEGGSIFENHDVTNVIAVYGYSVAYFVLFPILVLAVAWALARQPDPRAFRTYAFALGADYALSLPFFLLFPVPERWAYPDAGAILLSDLWDSRLIEAFRPMSALDNCFPSFHTSMTVVLVLCCFVYRVPFRLTSVPLGALVVLSTYSLGVHWLGDVIAGTAAGFVSVALACRLARR